MINELLALTTAFLYGCSSILAKKGLVKSNTYYGVLISLITNFLFLWLFYLLNPTPNLSIEPILFFSLAGILASFMGRVFHYTGMDKVGVSVNSSIVGSSALFATITATLLLNEGFGSFTYFGIVLVVSGIIFLSLSRGGEIERNWKSFDVIWSVLASICFGAANTTRKIGLNTLNQPFFGAAMGSSASLIIYFLYLIPVSRTKKVFSSLDRRSLTFFFLAGICTSFAWIFSFTATAGGTVTIVSSLVGTYPLFTLVLSKIILKEEITLQMLLSSLIIIVGVTLILLFS